MLKTINPAKPIVQLTRTGIMIKKFPSLIEASRETGVARPNINKALLGQRNHAGGFRWEYQGVARPLKTFKAGEKFLHKESIWIRIDVPAKKNGEIAVVCIRTGEFAAVHMNKTFLSLGQP